MKALCYRCPPWCYLACRGLGRLWPGVYFSRLAPARLREVEFREPLPAGWAEVRVRQCGLCASDVHLLRLQMSPFVAPAALLGEHTGMTVLGHELVGAVETGEGACGLGPGQRVISRSGGFRNCFNLHLPPCPHCAAGEYALCDQQGAPSPPHEPIRSGGFAVRYREHAANLLAVPDSLSDDEAVVAEPLACSLRAVLALAGTSAGRVLVIGAGTQGLGAIHWLKHVRPQEEVTCLARYDFQVRLAEKFGAAHVLTGRAPTEDLARQLGTRCVRGIGRNELLLGGFDAVIDSIGQPQTLGQAMRWTRPGGIVVLLGAHLFPGRLDYSPLWWRGLHLCGTYAHGVETFEGRRVGTLELTLELLAGRAPLPLPLVTHHLPLQQHRQAVWAAEHKRLSCAVKVALRPA